MYFIIIIDVILLDIFKSICNSLIQAILRNVGNL